jgi:hypothetical protein
MKETHYLNFEPFESQMQLQQPNLLRGKWQGMLPKMAWECDAKSGLDYDWLVVMWT